MDETTNDTVVEEVIEEETPEAELTPETDWEAEAKKARGIAQRALTKLKKFGETKVEKPVEPDKKTQNAGALDETALDYLDLKGISEDEDIAVIEKIVAKTGQTVRQALKDDYVIAKLASLKEAREVRAATPSSSKRSGNQSSDLSVEIAKFEKTGVLPDDFELATRITNAVADKNNVALPPWKR